jgi:hypothetical protein
MTISYNCTRTAQARTHIATDSLLWMASDHIAESVFDHDMSEGGAADDVNELSSAALDHVSPE